MENGYDVKAGMKIHMQTLNTIDFTKMLRETSLQIEDLIDEDGMNLFHELSNCIAKENKLVEYLAVIEKIAQEKYCNYEARLEDMLNTQTRGTLLTPLHLAIKNNRRKLLKEYIRLGANPIIKTNHKHSPLHIASKLGYCAIFTFFYETFRLDIDELDDANRTPLHLACLEGNENIALFIIAHSNNLTIKDTKGMTPLHLSAYSGSYRLCRSLIVKGVNRQQKDKRGRTPLDIARARQYTSLTGILVLFI